ncbi:MAG: hypothetical protein AAGJ87_00350 [Pseudomonadota bacterium]
MATIRTIFAGIGAAGAAGAAVVTGLTMRHADEDPGALTLIADPETEICLRTDLKFFAGAKRGCVDKAEIGRWRTAPVLDDRGAPVELNMSHPTDFQRDFEAVKSCGQYRRREGDGWYAGSTREMRREAFFERACGVISFLLDARAPSETFFQDGALTIADVRSLGEGPPFRIAPSADAVDAVMDAAAAEDGVWGLSSGEQYARIQEIAHADFNGDGAGDILTFVTVGVEGATASAGTVGFLEKTSADAPVRFKQ